MDLESIKENFSRLPAEELCNLLPDIAEMQYEEILLMKNELEKRSMHEEAKLICDYLDSVESQTDDLQDGDIKEIITKRRESGESMNQIKFDLKAKGIDISKVANEEQKREDKLFDYITSLKEDGLSISAIDKKLNNEMGLNPDQTKHLIRELDSRGDLNIKVGNILIIIALVAGIYLFVYGNRLSFGAIALFLSGIWRINLGKKQKR